MRVLYDARSVRTTTGAYVFQGLTSAWRRDSRVEEIFAAVPAAFDVSTLPAHVTPLHMPVKGGWLRHLLASLSNAADRVGADVIFCANATGPRDRRVVLYFQDLFHFHYRGTGLPLRGQLQEAARAGWRSIAASNAGLGIGVSRAITADARREVHRLPILEIPNGVEVGSAWWSGDDDVVYVAGGTGDRKSEETAVLAWARLPRRTWGARLDIGGVEPAPRRVDLQRLVRELGLDDVVTIRGALPREAYLERIARARLTVSCSRLESFGLPVAEALAIGAPVLCSDLPAHRELRARAGAGASFPVGDDVALAVQLRRALDGGAPARLSAPPSGWDWNTRAREHLDAYGSHLRV